jgi:predicted O-linked N-acetylglucosamine transferase (SPINDLY family)
MSDINNRLQQALLLHQSGQLDKSAKIYEDVLNAAPNHPDALHLLGVIAYQSGRYEEAEDKIRKAIEFAPQNSSYYLNLGATLKSSGKLDEAISAYEHAIRLNPNLYEPYYNLAISLNDAGRADASVSNYRKALQIHPDSSNALSNLVYLLQRLCRWDELCVLYSEIEQSTRNAILSGKKPVEMPPVSLIRRDDPALVFAVAKAWATPHPAPLSHWERGRGRGIKIGYVSSDFRNHPVASQMLSVFGLHDRNEFSVYCYSYGAEDGSYQRAEIRKSCDHFIDISRLNDTEAAQRIYQDGVDILVDLGGHTKGSRLNIFAHRPAPIQVSWLGFPATTGAGFMDYIITDKTVSPPEHASYYSEKFIYLPHTYMVNPYLQPISDRRFDRSDFGLPEGFVFCSFNYSYKIEPLMFDVWMRILADVPDAVLWLRRVNTDAEKNLRTEAEKRGINDERLIFSDKLASKAEHLSRLALADLALDTRIYNGHATSNDALWAGLPVLTLEGGHFASRACSSFLKAVGLSELITHSLKEYESLAVGLAHQPEKLSRIRQKLSKNRLTAPLFNTPHFVKNLEKAFRQMRALSVSGRQPEHITVEDTLNMEIINMDIPVYTSLNVEAAMQKAIAYHQSNEREKAEDIYRQILAAYPDHPDALQLSGVAAYQRGEYDEAVRLINKAIHIKPADPSYYSNLGVTLKSQDKLDEAIAAFQKALELNPDYPEASFNLGLSFQGQGKTDEAITYYQKALSLNPRYAEAHNNMGNIFRDQERTEEAIAAYKNAISINPEYAEAHSCLLFQAQLACEWKTVEQTGAKLAEMSRHHLEKGEKTPETPFSTLTMYINPARSLEIARSWCKEIARSVSSLTPFEHKKTVKSTLIIGYLSADFCHHPVAHQALSLFGLHDRQKFKVFAYSTGPDDKSYYRHRIQQDCDQFTDVRELSSADIAKRIYDDGVDILVDLMGHTRHSRLEIFALRPAPIQVTWLGFPGTTGADFIDYIIADKTIAPPEHAPYFSERLIYMPHAYMINDHHQPIIDKDWKRAEFGLAPDVFVFSSANKTYKIEPVMFDVWMNILRQVPNSVLWLRWVSDLAERNLKAEAQKRGISPDRLISSQKTPLKGEHLTRLKFADLALDTRIYNGHATTIDALWAGLPVLTLEGGHFASRACASFLKAIGLPEMITHSLQEYESLAIALAHQPERLVQIRQKLSKHRITAPLFNTPGFVRDLEHGYQQIWQIFVSGGSPRAIEVKSSENVEVLSDVAIHQELVQAIHLHESGNMDAAAAIYSKVLENFPNHADALHLYGVTAYQRGRYEQAASLIRKAIANFPTNPLYYNNLGLVLKDMNHVQEAIEAFEKAVQFKPDYAEPLFNLGILLRRQGKSQDAIACYEKFLAITPDHAEAYYNMGVAYQSMEQFIHAISCYRKVIEINPNHAKALNNLGSCLKDRGNTGEAFACFQKAAQLEENPETYFNLGNIYKIRFMLQDAIACYRKVLQLKPDYAEAYANLFEQFQHVCDWTSPEGMSEQLDRLNQMAFDAGTKTPETPFLNISRQDDPAKNLAVAKSWIPHLQPLDSSPSPKWRGKKITIGYVSDNFYNHPVAHLMLGLFGLHDRNRFKVICYATCKDDDSTYQNRIRQNSDAFENIRELNDAQAAQKIRDDGVDILVDLMGHTLNSRMGIFALRPAPVQLTWLGFPGTTGAVFFDYLIADKIVAPQEHAAHYSEKLLHLPNCYQINDHRQAIAEKNLNRADFGLPENTFVFCSFNQHFKIEPVMFDVWMNILKQVPDSVLWLIKRNELAPQNLRREAQIRGVNPERLIFAENLPKDEHLARHALADIALDTRIYNGHTTTSDALWAGVPAVGLLGNHFASRVSASLLSAIELPELIARNLSEYEALVLKLAKNPNELNRIRQKLAKNRLTAPLFDTPRFVKDLEGAYQWMLGTEEEQWYALGVSAYQQKKYAEAEDLFRKAISHSPNNFEYHTSLAAMLIEQGKFEDAAICCQKAIMLKSDHLPAYLNLGILFFKQNQVDKAIAAFEKASEIDPNHPEMLYSMGAAHKAKGEPDKAIACYQKAISIRPNWAEALYEMGKAYQAQNDFENAVSCYEKSFAIKPGDALAYYNMANSLRTIKRFEHAIAYYRKSIELQPDNAEAHYHQGLAYQLQERLDEAISCYEKAVNLKPNHTDYSLAYCVLYHQLQRICAWGKLKEMSDKIEYLTQKAIQTQTKTDEAPFENIARCDDPAKNFAVAKSWSRYYEQTAIKQDFSHDRKKASEKIIVGYISGDFRKHPVAQLILGLFALHDRNRFKVICYSHGRNDGGVYRQKIEHDCDQFVDLQALSNTEAARRIYQDEIDILVDLTGYTMTARPEIFAMRPAPIQISYLGFPGTSGADFFDYILTDRIISPESDARYYSEKFVYLPNCYMITDHAQPVSDKHVCRADVGLPEHAFVFCCFNQNLKIDPTIFDVWMNILRQVPDSVLWLIRENETSEKNLRQAAIARGVNDQRLIFRKKIPLKDEYLAYLNLADMALDTKIVNGHTTTVDALWAGVPVIAILGNHFASRVSASILTAIGLPELIARNLQEYEALVLKFAQNPNELIRIRQKLAKHRLTESLFDTPRFVRNLELLYQQICQNFAAGKAPVSLTLVAEKEIKRELNQALHLHQSGLIAQSEQLYAQILRKHPDHADAWHLSGMIAFEQGRQSEGIEKIIKAIGYSPNTSLYHLNLGVMFEKIGKMEDAFSCFQKAAALDPNSPEAFYNMAFILNELGRIAEAVSCCEQSLRLMQNHAKAWNLLGNIYCNQGRIHEAVNCYHKAIEIHPEYFEVYNNLGNLFKNPNSPNEAIAWFQKALSIKPDHEKAYAELCHQFQYICAWQKLDEMNPRIDHLTRLALQKGSKLSEMPLLNISRHADPALNYAVAKSWSSAVSKRMSKHRISFSFENRTWKKKIAIGYLSGDFHNHPVAHLISGIFRLHDRNIFEVICYSYGADDGSSYRDRIRNDCDQFVDISNLPDTEAAKRIYEDKIAILIDLAGHTGRINRLGICALRPAPIQIAYLGFPGTSGADFFDYILTDRIVSPQSHAPYYSEKFLYLPNCYQVNDHQQIIAEKNRTRADMKLPEGCVVFCSFNQPIKIEPVMFDLWMTILKKFPNSVLWLLKRNDSASDNLRLEARIRGVNPDRLIFAEEMPKDEHLARHVFVDLVLDTRIYNGHTTTSDAIWAGVPVITLLGNHFASRVSASILTAIGLPELIAHNLQEYEALVLKFAKNPNELIRIRQKLAKHRLTESLFDTPRFVRDLEQAYQQIYRIFAAGKAPVPPISDLYPIGEKEIERELNQALQLHQSGLINQAEKNYTKILAIYPEHADALHLSGLIAYQQGRHIDAVEKIQKAIQYSPDNEMYHSNLGAAFKAQNKFEEAISAYRRALQIDPNFAKARDNLAELCFEQGTHLKNTGKPDEAIKWYQEALNIKPGFEKAYTAMYHQFQHLCQWQPLETMNPRVDLMSKSAIENHAASPEMPLMNITRHADPALNLLVAQSWSNVISDRIPKPEIDIKAELQCAFNLHQAGQIEAAEAIYLKILEIAPNTADALHLLGLIAHLREEYDQATELIGKALEISPNSAIFHSNLGAALQGKKKNDEAVAEYRKALSLAPNYQEAKSNLDIIVKNWIDSGFSLQCQGKFAEALPLYQKAIEFVTNDGLLYLNLGICLHSIGKWDEAMSAYRKTIELNPTQPDVYMNLGLLLQNMKRSEEAIAMYQKAIEVRPENPDAYNNIGICLQNMGKTLQAIAAYQKSVELKPDNIGAYLNMGNSFRIAEKFEEAIASYQKALEYNPDYAEAFCSMYHQLQYICDWTGIEANNEKLDALTNAALDKGQKTMETPFVSLTRVADPAKNLAIAKTWSGEISAKCKMQNAKFEIQRAKFKEGKITIGYLSGDFRNHPVAHLMSGLFKLHNRQEFEIICYSYGRNDGSEYRKQIESGCDQFVDIREMSYEAAAERIHQDKVDILVEMMGFTGTDNRLEICALRPAPIQVSYLGFPGSIGADFFDYIITDRIVSPPEHAPYYTEKLAYLPHCYQVNNHEQQISDTLYRRQDFGLPQHGFIFSSFNQPYKIEPVMFDVWMRILKQIPDSVLWLLWRSQSAENNLKREAQIRGVSPDRLIFAKRIVKPEHLARQRLADLVLDTRIYNGHTTTSDALWAGVPVVALEGTHFASRVSSSILSAIGLPELITRNLEDYEQLVLRLASYPEELKVLRQRLAKNRLTQPLFDTPLFAKNLENLYKEMWEAFKSW